jgi:hypothetical protein
VIFEEPAIAGVTGEESRFEAYRAEVDSDAYGHNENIPVSKVLQQCAIRLWEGKALPHAAAP